MLKPEEIANVSFRRANLGGYRPEDVDAFIDQVQLTIDQMQKDKAELAQKLELLAKKVEEYRNDEESIRTTLLSAQKLADASVREAKHKSEVIIKDATVKAEKIVANAQRDIEDQQKTIENLQKEVVNFRSRLLAIYKEHLTLIDALPTEETFQQEKKAESIQEPESSTPEEKEEQPAVSDDLLTDIQPMEGGFTVKQPEQPVKEEGNESSASSSEKFGALKFGDDYDLSKDKEEESPIGLFKRK